MYDERSKGLHQIAMIISCLITFLVKMRTIKSADAKAQLTLAAACYGKYYVHTISSIVYYVSDKDSYPSSSSPSWSSGVLLSPLSPEDLT